MVVKLDWHFISRDVRWEGDLLLNKDGLQRSGGSFENFYDNLKLKGGLTGAGNDCSKQDCRSLFINCMDCERE